MYFASVIDVFSRGVLGWPLASHMRTTLVLDALRMAPARRRPGADVALVHHSDAGGTETLDDHGVLASIGTVGDALDNALAESFVDSSRTQLISDRVWPTRTGLEFAIVEDLDWFNTSRLHSALGDLPSAEFDALHAPRDQTSTHTIKIQKQQTRSPSDPVRFTAWVVGMPACLAAGGPPCAGLPGSTAPRGDAAARRGGGC